MTVRSDQMSAARDQLPDLDPADIATTQDRPVAGNWTTSVGLVAGFAVTVFAGFWLAASGPATAEADSCLPEKSTACAAWTAFKWTFFSAETP